MAGGGNPTRAGASRDVLHGYTNLVTTNDTRALVARVVLVDTHTRLPIDI